jgi:hypothetical protein
MSDFFDGDPEGIEAAEGYYAGGYEDMTGEESFDDGYDEGYTDAEEDLSADGYPDMTEEEAFEAFDLAFALGLGEEIGLEEADRLRGMGEERKQSLENEREEVRSLRSRHTRRAGFIPEKKGNISALTGKYKCPYEKWMMDVAKGRRKITDPMNINIFEEEF